MTISDSFLRVKHLYDMELNLLVQFATSRLVHSRTSEGPKLCPCGTVTSDAHWPTCEHLKAKLIPTFGANRVAERIETVLQAKVTLMSGAMLDETTVELYPAANEILKKIVQVIREQ